jgi:hypothetical protein
VASYWWEEARMMMDGEPKLTVVVPYGCSSLEREAGRRDGATGIL